MANYGFGTAMAVHSCDLCALKDGSGVEGRNWVALTPLVYRKLTHSAVQHGCSMTVSAQRARRYPPINTYFLLAPGAWLAPADECGSVFTKIQLVKPPIAPLVSLLGCLDARRLKATGQRSRRCRPIASVCCGYTRWRHESKIDGSPRTC